METDNTQSDGQTPEGSDSQPGEQGNPEQSGVNKRFSELTGIIKDQKATIDNLQAMVQQSLAAQTQLAAAQAQARQVQPEGPPQFNLELPQDVDPNVAKLFTNLTQTFTKALEYNNKRVEETIGRAVGGIRMNQEQMEFQQAVQGASKEVQELAGRLLQDWRAKGKTGWEARDAVTFAKGMLGAGAPGRAGPDNQELPPGGGGMSPPNPRTAANGARRLSDEEVARMPLKKQEEYWEKVLGNAPIEY